jgi:hypothetical protein
MGKLTDEQAKTLADLQALADADDDEDDYEVLIENDKGQKTRLPSKKAGGWLKENFGIDLHPDPAGDAGDDGDGDAGDDGKDPGPKGGGGYFKSRKG